MSNANSTQQKPVESDWVCLSIEGRVDSFNQEDFKVELSQDIEKKTKNILLEMENAEFLSLKFIKYISDLAEVLKAEKRQLALCGMSEKLKRQFLIYASLNSVNVYRSKADFVLETTAHH